HAGPHRHGELSSTSSWVSSCPRQTRRGRRGGGGRYRTARPASRGGRTVTGGQTLHHDTDDLLDWPQIVLTRFDTVRMVAQDHQLAGRYHPFHSHLLRNRVTRYRGDPLHVPLLRVQCAPGHRQIVPASVRVGPLQQDDSATLDPSTA